MNSNHFLNKIALFCLVLVFFNSVNRLNAQNRIQNQFQSQRKDVTNEFPIQSLSSADTLQLGLESDLLYYSTRFGNGLLLSVKLPDFGSDSVSIYGFELHFYGGRTDETRDLSTARLKGMMWNNVDSSITILPTNSFKSTSNIDINLTAEEIRPVLFTFSDTSIFNPKNLWVGIRYENASDTNFAISPIFYHAPALYESLFYRTVVIDTARTDTLRFSHTTFWNNPDSIGGLWGWIYYKNKKVGSPQTVSIKPLIEKPIHLSVQAYPNPFNPRTQFLIQSNGIGEIELSIYSITGQLIQQEKWFGSRIEQRVFEWNAESLPSGMYIAKVLQNNEISVIKITLLK